MDVNVENFEQHSLQKKLPFASPKTAESMDTDRDMNNLGRF